MSNEQDRTAIRKAIEDWSEANRNKDAGKVATFFANDVVFFDIAPPLKHSGFDRDALAKWFASWDGKIGYEVTDQVITVSDTLAMARSIDHMTGKKLDGEKVDMWTRSTVCFRKDGGQWKVVHVHNSVPLMMDGSNKAATDLNP